MAFVGLFLALATCTSALKASVQIPPIPDADTVSRASAPGTEAEFSVMRMPSRGNLSPMSNLQVVESVIQLKRGNASSLSSMYVQAMRAQASGRNVTVSRANYQYGQVPLNSINAGTVFLAPITVGGQDFEVVIDTGSSDPWLAATGFDCIDSYDYTDAPEEYCNFGPLYDVTKSKTFKNLPDRNMNLSYADGEALNGLMGYEAYTMAGVTVPNQQFGVVNYAAWLGDGISSGLVGFAYSSLTSAFAGTDPKADVRGKQINYNTFFTNMISTNLTLPVFSMAMSRDESIGGVMALGGIPDIPISSYWVSTPIIPYVFLQSKAIVYDFYTIVTDGFAYSNKQNEQFNVFATQNTKKKQVVGNGTRAIVDSGTSLIYVPNNIAVGVTYAFTPPGVCDPSPESEDATCYVDCDAIPPLFGVSIGKKIFYVNAADMILQNGPDSCISSVQANLGGLTILGDAWMKNVLCVFDIGAEMMRFAARQFYGFGPKGANGAY